MRLTISCHYGLGIRRLGDPPAVVSSDHEVENGGGGNWTEPVVELVAFHNLHSPLVQRQLVVGVGVDGVVDNPTVGSAGGLPADHQVVGLSLYLGDGKVSRR